MSASWVSKIGVPNPDGSAAQPMQNPWRPTPLGGTRFAGDISAPTLTDGTAGLAAYGFHSICARFHVAGGTSAVFQVWGWNDWFGYWFKVGSPVTVLADAAGELEIGQLGVDRIMAQVTGTGSPTSVDVQFAGFSMPLQ